MGQASCSCYDPPAAGTELSVGHGAQDGDKPRNSLVSTDGGSSPEIQSVVNEPSTGPPSAGEPSHGKAATAEVVGEAIQFSPRENKEEALDVAAVRQLLEDMRWHAASSARLQDGVKLPGNVVDSMTFQMQQVKTALASLRREWWPEGESGEYGKVQTWKSGNTLCCQSRLDKNCLLRSSIDFTGTYEFVQQCVLDFMPIPADKLLATFREVDLWKEVVDPSGVLNLHSERVGEYSPNDILVRVNYKVPVPLLAPLEFTSNRSLCDLLHCEGSFNDKKGSFPAGFAAIEWDTTTGDGKTWRGMEMPPTTKGHKLIYGRNIALFAEIVEGGVRLHLWTTGVLPVPNWLLPRNLFTELTTRICQFFETTMLTVAWDPEDSLSQTFAKRMEQETEFYKRFRGRVGERRKQAGWAADVARPELPPRAVGKCERPECRFAKHTNLGISGGTHCCGKCKHSSKGSHGPMCQRKVYQPPS